MARRPHSLSPLCTSGHWGGGEPGPGSLGKGKFWVALSPDFWLVYFRKAEDMVKLFLKVSWPQLWGALV